MTLDLDTSKFATLQDSSKYQARGQQSITSPLVHHFGSTKAIRLVAIYPGIGVSSTLL
jgi:hypothetical protein